MKNRYSIDLATEEDAKYVASHLREADLAELHATFGTTDYYTLQVRQTWLVSRDTCFAGRANGQTVCIFGVRPNGLLSDTAMPWMLGTPAISEHARAFLRHSRKIVDTWTDHFPVLRNYVDARNTEAIRWLQWLGFSVYSAKPWGPLNMPFHKFEKRS